MSVAITDEQFLEMQYETLIIIPTYNEKENIQKMISTLFHMYPEINLLIVDDSSPDKTFKIVEENQKTYKNLFLLKRKNKDGLANAYIAGFKYAIEHKFKNIIQMDCDFSHDPIDIRLLLTETKNADIVIGSRYIDGLRVINWPIKRLFISYCASLYIRAITKIPIIDCTGGFKCIKVKVLEVIDLNDIISKGYIFQTEINYKAWIQKFKLKEVPIIFYERTHGESKIHKSMMIEGIKNVLLLKYQAMKNK